MVNVFIASAAAKRTRSAIPFYAVGESLADPGTIGHIGKRSVTVFTECRTITGLGLDHTFRANRISGRLGLMGGGEGIREIYPSLYPYGRCFVRLLITGYSI